MDAQQGTPQGRREKPDPTELARPAPPAVLVFCGVMALWGAAYIVLDKPSQPAALGDHRTLADLAAKPGAAAGAGADGAAIYTARCVACHQATGQGLPGVFPPLAGSEWVTGGEKVLVQILLHGIEGPITVKGTTYNGAMPPLHEQLDDAAIAAVGSYVRSQWGNAAPPVTAATVAEERKATSSRSGPWKGEAELTALK